MHFKINRKILDNGMRLLFIPMTNSDTVSMGIYVKAGSRYETVKENGIAHFLEHMMFKGTKHMSSVDIATKLDSVGAKYNAGTSYESTYYYLYGHKEYTKLFIDIISDIYINPVFHESDILTERNVVVEELNMMKDEPSEIIHNLMYETLFSNSSLGLPIIGTKNNILNFTRNDFINFRKNKYTSDRTVFVIAGNFNLKNISKYVVGKFKHNNFENNNSKHIMIPFSPEIKQSKSSIIVNHNKNISQTHIIISFKSDNIYSDNLYIYDIVADILASGSSSRLFDLLRNKLGITYFINVYNTSYLHEGVFTIHIGVDNKRVDEAINKILKELKDIKINGITNDELNKAKNIRISSVAVELQTPNDLMSYYGMQELIYNVGASASSNVDRTKVSTLIDNYKKIDKKTVNNLINSLFVEHNMNIFIYGTKNKSKLNKL